ncbi:MAG TPA: DUF1800 family protein [Casimicrobiaceae bacterium]|nr:DUF1800 family protein [Casimicrobiaceae bacterium]
MPSNRDPRAPLVSRARAASQLVVALAFGGLASLAWGDASPVYRFYNTAKGTHFYTISATERDDVMLRYPTFAYEGPVFWAFAESAPGTSPVYRFFNKQTGTHFYTASESEKDYVIATYPALVFEGPAYYLSQGPGADRTALYRFYNTKTGAHFYTTSAQERDNVIATYPQFAYEGTAFYVYADSTPPEAANVVTTLDAWRLLNQATFGATQAEVARVKSMGLAGWVADQFTQPISGYPDTKYNRIQLTQTVDCGQKDANGANYTASAPQFICYRDNLTPTGMARDLFTNAVSQPDQLRQRVAWALSQILVTSTTEPDLFVAYPMARYQNILFQEAFGNFETLLQRITLSPAMGNYLDMVNNDKANTTTGKVPNENYAREIMQLFSIGLIELKADGTPVLDAQGQPVATYDQAQIKEFARVFTGWTYAKADGTVPTAKDPAFYNAPMMPYPNGHDTAAKTLLNNQTLPAAQTIQKDLADAIHNIFMHHNVGPFIGKQLIQKLVTGNPSPGYVARVAAKFNDNGSGVRGDMKAVIQQILLDPEARGDSTADATFGSLRDPVLMVTSLVRALGGTTDGFDLANRTANLGQRPYSSPTVFNFFSPDSTIPGTSVLAPEFGIHNSNSAVARTNLIYTLVYNGIAADNTVPNATGTKLNTQQFESLASNPTALVDKVNQVLLGGALPSAVRDTIAQAVSAVAASDAPNRARMAVYLAASSYQFQVQH